MPPPRRARDAPKTSASDSESHLEPDCFVEAMSLSIARRTSPCAERAVVLTSALRRSDRDTTDDGEQIFGAHAHGEHTVLEWH